MTEVITIVVLYLPPLLVRRVAVQLSSGVILGVI